MPDQQAADMSYCPRCRAIMFTLSPLGYEHNHEGPQGLSDMMETFGATLLPLSVVIDTKQNRMHRMGALQLQPVRLGIPADWNTACGQTVHGYPTERGWGENGTLTVCRACPQA